MPCGQRWLIPFLLILTACGGGSGGSGTSLVPPPPVVDTPAPTMTELAVAARFANRASFGLSFDEISRIARNGQAQWLDRQFALPVGLHSNTVAELLKRRDAGEFAEFEQDVGYLVQFRRFAWWDCAVRCEDVLRQRVAFALSQIFVVSDNVDALLDWLDIVLSQGSMSGATRDVIRGVLLELPDRGIRARLGIYMVMMSADYVVEL